MTLVPHLYKSKDTHRLGIGEIGETGNSQEYSPVQQALAKSVLVNQRANIALLQE